MVKYVCVFMCECVCVFPFMSFSNFGKMVLSLIF